MARRNWKTSRRRLARHHRPTPPHPPPAPPQPQQPRSSPSSVAAGPPPPPSVGGDDGGDGLTDVDSILRGIIDGTDGDGGGSGGGGGSGSVSGSVSGNGNSNTKASGDDNADEAAYSGSRGGEGKGDGSSGMSGGGGSRDCDGGPVGGGSNGAMSSKAGSGGGGGGGGGGSESIGGVSSQLFSSSFPEPSSLGSGSVLRAGGSLGSGSAAAAAPPPLFPRRAGSLGSVSAPRVGRVGGGGYGFGVPSVSRGVGGAREEDGRCNVGVQRWSDRGGTSPAVLRRTASEPMAHAGGSAAADVAAVGGAGDDDMCSATAEASAYVNADGPVIYARRRRGDGGGGGGDGDGDGDGYDEDDTVSQITSSLAGNTTLGSSYLAYGYGLGNLAGGGGGGGSPGASAGAAGGGAAPGGRNAPPPAAAAAAAARSAGGGARADGIGEIAFLLDPKSADASVPGGPPGATATRDSASATGSTYSARYKTGSRGRSGGGAIAAARRGSHSSGDTMPRRNSFPEADDMAGDGGVDTPLDDDTLDAALDGVLDGGGAGGAGGDLHAILSDAIRAAGPALERIGAAYRRAARSVRGGAGGRWFGAGDGARRKKDDDDDDHGGGRGRGAAGGEEEDYFSLLTGPSLLRRTPAHLRTTPEQRRRRATARAVRAAVILTVASAALVGLRSVMLSGGGRGRGRGTEGRGRGGGATEEEEEEGPTGDDDTIDPAPRRRGGQGGQAKRGKVRGGMAHHSASDGGGRPPAARGYDRRDGGGGGGPDPLPDLPRSVQGPALPPAFDVLADVADVPGEDDEALPFFWHVPRTGGATVNDVLGGCLYLTLASDAGGADGHGRDETLQVLKFRRHFSYVNVDTSTSEGIDRARRLGLAESGLADVVVSSLLHEALTLFTPRVRGRMFALFRHPVERAASLFHYVQDTQWKGRGGQLADITMDEFFHGGMAENNWMTRFLTGQLTKGELDTDDLDLAKEVLRRKCLVGLLGEKGESFARFERYFGWRPHSDADRECHEKKVQWAWPLKHRHDEVEEGTPLWDLILDHNAFDMELYEYAQALFEEQRRLFQ